MIPEYTHLRANAAVRFVSTGRVRPALVEGDVFFLLRPPTGHDGALRAAGWHAVSGPFPLADPRFEVAVTPTRH